MRCTMLVLLALMVQCWFSLAEEYNFIEESTSEEAIGEYYDESDESESGECSSETPSSTTSEPEVCETEYIVHWERVNWHTAKARCSDYGSSLVSIENKDVLEKVKRAVEKSGGTDARHFWTSGTNEGEEGKWVWSTTGEPMTFMNWDAPEPNNLGGAENCLELIYTYRFNDNNCDTFNINYICQRQVCV